ncbi:MAG: TRAP transporter small permease [Pseudomonadota bacterium]
MVHQLQRAGLWLARILLTLSALCLTALMLLTVAEVIGRYGFNAPIYGRQDIAQILLALSIFCAFPVVTLRNDHIAVDLLDGFFSKSTAVWRDRTIELLTAATLMTMGVWLFERAEKALSRGSTSELLSLPKYPLLGAIAIIVGVSGLLLGLRTVFKIAQGRTEQPE